MTEQPIVRAKVEFPDGAVGEAWSTDAGVEVADLEQQIREDHDAGLAMDGPPAD